MRKRAFLYIFTLLNVSLHSVSYSQRYIRSDFSKSMKFDVENNLTAVHLIQDRTGFLWITSNDGVRCYDGYSFKSFKNEKGNKNSLNTNQIQAICESRDGLIWIGTGGSGVNIYNPRTNTFETMMYDSNNTNSLSSNLVFAICEDPDGNMWFGTFGGGACRYNRAKKEFKRFAPEANNKSSLSGLNVRDFVIDNNKQLWIGVDGGGLCKFDKANNRFVRFQHNPADPQSIASDIILDICKDKSGCFWTGTWEGGVTKFDPATGKALKILKNDPLDPHSLANNISFGIAQDPDGRIWISTWKGLEVYDEKTGVIHHFEHNPLDPTSLPNNQLFDVYCDKFGCMWILSSGGVCKVNMLKKKFSVFKHEFDNRNSLNSNDLSCMTRVSTGEYWIASQGDGINIVDFDNLRFKFLSHDARDRNSPLSNSRPTAVFQDFNGSVWMSTTAGVDVYNPATLRKERHFVQNDYKNKDSLQNNVVNAFVNDRGGDLWMCTFGGGVFRYNYKTNKFKMYPIDKANQMNNVGLHMILDSDGKIWVATKNSGLCYYDAKSDALKFITHDEQNKSSTPSTNNLQYIHEDADGTLWIGTSGSGIDRFDRKTHKFSNYCKANSGLSDDIVVSITSQGKYLWVATAAGLTKFNKETCKSVQNFDESDGLHGTAFADRSVYRNEYGLLLFGGPQGLTAFNPDSIWNNPVDPKVVFTELKVNNQVVKPGDDSPLDENITFAREIHLSSLKDKNIYIEFAVLHFSNPLKNQYKYMLEGFDTGWTTTTVDRRFAQYTNLSGGTYTFRVVGSNCDGVWDTKGASVKIIVRPPFYQTFWFYGIVALCVVGVFYLITKAREKKSLLEKKHMQETIDNAVNSVEEQKKEILRQNDELQKRREEDHLRQWFNEGIALFSDLLRKNKNNVDELASTVLQNVIHYIGANQGGIYVLNEDDESDKYLQLVSSYAYSTERLDMSRVEIGEMLVGNCFQEGKTKLLANIPDNYLTITSALGSISTKSLLLVPLKQDELVFGVMEIGSLQPITPIQIELLEKLSEIVTAQLFNMRMNEKTAHLLSQSQRMAEEMHIREMQTTKHINDLEVGREEAQRQRQESDEYLVSLSKALLRADIDTHGKILLANELFCETLGVAREEVKYLHISDLINSEQQAQFLEGWQNVISGSETLQMLLTFGAGGQQAQLYTVFSPVKDYYGTVQKVLFLAHEVQFMQEPGSIVG